MSEITFSSFFGFRGQQGPIFTTAGAGGGVLIEALSLGDNLDLIQMSWDVSTFFSPNSLPPALFPHKESQCNRNNSKRRDRDRASIRTPKTPPAVVYGGPCGPQIPRKIRKKSRLNKNFKPQYLLEGEEFENQSQLQSC